MNNAIGLNLQIQPSVESGSAISAGAGQMPLSCKSGECTGLEDVGFFEVLNAELEALVDSESIGLLALAQVEDLENIEEVGEFEEISIASIAVFESLQGNEKSDELFEFVDQGLLQNIDEVSPELEVAFKQALSELPENITSLPLTPENKIFIQQQALALVEQKHPELVAALQQKDGQLLPLEGKLLPLVDDFQVVSEFEKPIHLATVVASNSIAKDIVQSAKDKISLEESLNLELESDSELNFKNIIETSNSKKNFDGNDEKYLVDVLSHKNGESKDVPIQKFSTEAVSTSVNNILGANQASINMPNAAAVQSGTTLQLPQNPSPQQWGSALGDKVQWMINTKMESAEIRIDPPHLGKMDISIKMTDDGAQVIIQTQHAATRELVDAASHRLKEMLEQAGHENVDVDVSHKESNQSDSQFAQNDESNEQQAFDNSTNAENDEVTQNIISGTFNQERPGLDLFA